MSSASAFDALFNRGRDLFREQLCDAMDALLAGTDEAFAAMLEKAGDEDVAALRDARDAGLACREAIGAQFRSRYPGEFTRQANKARGVAPSLSDISLDDLELVGEDDLNETLKLNDMAAQLRRRCEDELAALDQRVGVLLGDAGLEADANPFGPGTVLAAFKLACRHSECPPEGRIALLELFGSDAAEGIKGAYQQLNGMLVENGILPKIRYGISRTEDKAAPSTATAAQPADAPQQAPEDLFAALARAMGGGAAPGGGNSGGAPGMGVGGVPLVQGAELMGSLTQLQVGDLSALGEAAAELGPLLQQAGELKNVLHQLKNTSVGAGMGQVDAMTLDIVAMLFDELFEDPNVPVPLKSLIGRLQLPILKVAIADKDLFTRKDHPARQLLDVLGQIGLQLPPDFDADSALFTRLEAYIHVLVEGFREKLEIFDTVRGDLERIVAEHQERVAVDMQGQEEQMRREESLAVAMAAAQQEIHARVEATSSLPRAVVVFLAAHWIKPMMVAHATRGAGSDAWRESLDTVDRLLWSVAPKTTQDERRELAKSIPALLKSLKSGVAEGQVDENAASLFFSELMKCHTEALKPAPPPKKSTATGGERHLRPDPHAKAASATARTGEPVEDLMDFNAPVTLANPFGGGALEVSSGDLDFTPNPAEAAIAAVLDQPAAAAKAAPFSKTRPGKAIHLPVAMIQGVWVHVLDGNGVDMRLARLHYVSPKKSHYLFVDRRGRKVYECTRRMLAQRVKLGEVAILDGEPDASLFDRIVSGLFGKLKKPVPVPA